jgi:hypothetical protein
MPDRQKMATAKGIAGKKELAGAACKISQIYVKC